MTGVRSAIVSARRDMRERFARRRAELFGTAMYLLLRSERVARYLRRRRRLMKLPGVGWFVTRHADVCEVLARDDAFPVVYGPKMEAMTGPFFLGMNDPPYGHEKSALRAVVLDEDLARIARSSEARARELVADADGRIDVIAELTDPVVEATLPEYIGIPPLEPGALLAWSRPVFHEVFLNAQNEVRVTRAAAAAAQTIHPHLRSALDDRWERIGRGEEPSDTVLDRLLVRLEAEDEPFLALDRIHDTLFGLIVAWAVSVSRATGRALDELLRRPAILRGAQQAARDGDDEAIDKYLLEALRFNPQAPIVERLCPGGATIAQGTRTEAVIPPRAKLIVHTTSAMMDAAGPHLVDGAEFRVDRPPELYLHFGHGVHRCFGEHISRAQMTAITMALLSEREVRREGELKLDGPFPVELPVGLGLRPSPVSDRRPSAPMSRQASGT